MKRTNMMRTDPPLQRADTPPAPTKMKRTNMMRTDPGTGDATNSGQAINPTTLSTMRLPELQAKYAEVVGKETRCPNRRWLVTRIEEALAARAKVADTLEQATLPEPTTPLPDAGEKLTHLDIDQLRAKYAEVVGRPTNSTNKAYLVWRLRQAIHGKVPVGPIKRPRADKQPEGERTEYKVIPLRLEAELVRQIDEAVERMGMKSRVELFRKAVGGYL